ERLRQHAQRQRAAGRGQGQAADAVARGAAGQGGDAGLEVLELRLQGREGGIGLGQGDVGNQLVEGVRRGGGVDHRGEDQLLAAGQQVLLLGRRRGQRGQGRAGVVDGIGDLALARVQAGHGGQAGLQGEGRRRRRQRRAGDHFHGAGGIGGDGVAGDAVGAGDAGGGGQGAASGIPGDGGAGDRQAGGVLEFHFQRRRGGARHQ